MGIREMEGRNVVLTRAENEPNLDQQGDAWSGPHVDGELPGTRSVEYLARQARTESNARAYPRHLPSAIAEGQGSFVRDVDGNVFIDFLAGAGVLSLGHGHPELVAA